MNWHKRISIILAVLVCAGLLAAFNIDSDAGNSMEKVAITADTTRARFLVVVHYNDHSGYNQILSHTVNWNGGQISPAVNYSTGVWWDSAAGPSVVYNPQMDEYLLVD